jgi:hypothetical protein
MQITSIALLARGQVSSPYINGEKIERTAFVHLEVA